ncbi:Chaperone activity of bc1 complex-like, mitochondrial [Zootermopsis nevadensis]|uniref:Chaperone activity of bc1 complex-like, mitochondrial n=1 Tax=Zootermopsis nevadensis TaxID=136037 RepID=A0A067RSN5_ZOONE|nr:Chaperone activity of bc1 complex-like, mitochondrial [Zootermopsis nevadensis]
MSQHWSHDISGILRGVRIVVNAMLKHQEAECKQCWENSSIKDVVEKASSSVVARTQQRLSEDKIQNHLSKNVQETFQRTSMLYEGIKAYVTYAADHKLPHDLPTAGQSDIDNYKLHADILPEASETTKSEHNDKYVLKETESANSKNKDVSRDLFAGRIQKQQDLFMEKAYSNVVSEQGIVSPLQPSIKFEATHVPVAAVSKQDNLGTSVLSVRDLESKTRMKQVLSATAKQRKVPSSQFFRKVSFGSLAAGLVVGTVTEMARRSLGLANEEESAGRALDSVFLSEANAERIVNTLCKLRGAALKLGQILSMQDNTVISPTLQKAFERVRQSADFMPTWQVEKVLESELGGDWRSKVTTFEPMPFAAASIGQVHLAVLPSGTEVAMKIQYPGVAKGIESDIDSLVQIMDRWNVFPKSFFIDNLVKVAKRELAWEVDYIREAECTKKFQQLLEPYPEYYVAQVVDSLSTKQIFTTELMSGIPVDKCVDLDLETRTHISRLVIELWLKELFEFRYMQTDPNWSNFFYSPETRQLMLLDFGASRSYSKTFVDMYIQLIRGAADGDRNKVLQVSRDIGFLAGYEAKIMEDAHVEAVMILGEVFHKSSEPYDFGSHDTTRRIQSLIPTMLKHRLCPPPEEVYSLHRKLSGIFMLVSKLGVKLECKSMFEKVYEMYRSG